MCSAYNLHKAMNQDEITKGAITDEARKEEDQGLGPEAINIKKLGRIMVLFLRQREII